MHNDKRNIFLTTAVLLVVCVVIAQRVIVAPHHRQLAAIRQQLQDEQKQLRMQQAIAKTWPLVQQYQVRLPETSSPDWLMREVAKLAEQVHVKLTTIEPGVSRPYQHGAMGMSVQVRLESSYHEVGQFVSLLERSPKYIHVDELELRPAKPFGNISAEAEQPGVATSVRMVLSTLYLPPLSER